MKDILFGHTRKRGFKWWQFIKRYKDRKYRKSFYRNLASIEKTSGRVPKYK